MKIKLLILSILFIFIMLFVTLPVEGVIGFLPNNSRIKIATAKGTLWRGEASQVSYQHKFKLQKVSWDLDWSALAGLQLKLSVKFTNGVNALHGEGFAILSWSGLSVEDLTVEASVPELTSYFYLPRDVQVQGQISAVIKEASTGAPYCQKMEGYIDWHKAVIESTLGIVRLGAPHTNLQCESGNVVANIKQTSNDLTSEVNVVLEENKIYRVKGTLKPGATLAPEFNQLLRWLGPKNAVGEKSLNFSGRL